MLKSVLATASKIRELKIQGAQNVAIAAVEAIETLANQTQAKTKQEFLHELSEAKNNLFATRETEPMMRNAVRWIISRVKKSNETEIKKLATIVSASSARFLKNLQQGQKRIVEIGAKRIEDNSLIFTHCHSSTVTQLLKKAKQLGKTFEVICTETRPLFQGRLTAKELLALDIKTTMIVDSAVRHFINRVDLAIVGADAITSEGNVINKVGTSMMALAAHEARTRFYVASQLLKFDPATLYGYYAKIEERSANEIWEHSPRNLRQRNPAFDVTPRDYVHGLICEEGVISPHSVAEVVRRKYPWIFERQN